MKNIKILYEDKNLIVIDKPAGLTVHSSAEQIFNKINLKKKKTQEKTVVDFILDYDIKIEKVGESIKSEYKGEQVKIPRPGIVHRLDKETSGVLIIARNQKTFLFLKDQFQNHKIKKTYKAFVYGYVSDPRASLLTGKRGIINVPIGRSPKDIRMYTAGRGAKEPLREAVTEYTVLDRFTDTKKEIEKKEVDHQYSYIEVYPKTGRTHQIRVHMRYINHPIVSDSLYGGSKNFALGMKRLALHAHFITFSLPNGESKTVEAPLPSDFKNVIKTYLNKI